jgi:hypothetical protein
VLTTAKHADEHIVALLIAERDKINRAIEALQAQNDVVGPRKNPAIVATEAATSGPSANGRGTRMTAAARKAQSQRMKAYWAKRKKEAGKK